jgi:hypothetical protein
LWTPSWDKFDEYIRDHNIAFVVARKDDPFPQSRYEGIGNLIAEHPERFRLLREDNYYLLFRVVHEPVSNISARE